MRFVFFRWESLQSGALERLIIFSITSLLSFCLTHFRNIVDKGKIEEVKKNKKYSQLFLLLGEIFFGSSVFFYLFYFFVFFSFFSCSFIFSEYLYLYVLANIIFI